MKYLLKDAWNFACDFHNSILFVLFIIVLVFSFNYLRVRDNKHAKENRYENIELRIISINSDCSLTNDKFHKPQLCNTVLFETITGTHLYCEINTCEKGSYGIHIDTKWLYNHQMGDIVHFDYLCKDRFFEIKPR